MLKWLNVFTLLELVIHIHLQNNSIFRE